ncbi:MAG: ABC transporter permease [Candidatus Hydrogenedentes bacterium]|nr:ABC transporter permease [Candidatus Hydrogenedentota bacterium]
MKFNLRNLDTVAPIITCAVLFLFFSFITESFLTRENLLNILRQNSALAVMAVGVTFVLLTGEIDLSIESMAILAGVVAAWLFNVLLQRLHWTPGPITQMLPLLAAIAGAAVFGLVIGVGVSRIGVPSFMMTLALSLIAMGLALWITGGSPIFTIQPALAHIGTRSLEFVERARPNGTTYALIEIPWITVVAAIFMFAAWIVLRFTRFGRNVYAVGGNRVAAELSGIPVARTLTACFCICAMTAAVAGTLWVGRLGSAQAGGLDQVLIQCVSGVVLGGTSLFGGKGGIGNTVVGVLTFGILHNGLNHLDVNIYLKGSIMGAILLAALILNVSMARVRRA